MSLLAEGLWCLVVVLVLVLPTGALEEVNHRSLNAPYASHVSADEITSSSINVRFDEFYSREGGDTLAYEVSRKSVFGGSSWEVTKDDIGGAGFNKSELQILSVRVDDDQTLSSGTFVLGLDREGKTPDDVEALTRTRHISFDASAETVLAALGDLVNVKVRHVRRCDYFGGNNAHGGAEGWIHGCPHGGRGGFRWLIVFDVPMAGQTLPLLKAYRVELGNTWTGLGMQVSSKRIQTGMINPALCHKGECSFNVTGLAEGNLYHFRYRAMSSFSGWSGYSKTSVALSTLEHKLPTRPRPPVVSTVTESSARVLVPPPRASERVDRVECQVRQVGDTHWGPGPSYSLGVLGERDAVDLSMLVSDLEPGTSYEIRMRSVNDLGAGLYSTPSYPLVTKPSMVMTEFNGAMAAITGVLPSSDGLRVEVSATAAGAHVDIDGRHTYSLQYKSPADPVWLTWAEPIPLETFTAVPEVQVLMTRKSSTHEACQGLFHFSTASDSYNDIIFIHDDKSLSTGIKFDATAEEVRQAVLGMPKVDISSATVHVDRNTNSLGGFTYTITIVDTPSKKGRRDVPQLVIARNHMVASRWQERFEGTSPAPLDRVSCWDNGESVTISTVQQGRELAHGDSKNVSMYGLDADTPYSLRVLLERGGGHATVQGTPVSARTTYAIAPGSTVNQHTTSMSDGFGISASKLLARGDDRLSDRNTRGGLYQTVSGSGVYPGKVNQAVVGMAQDQDYLPDSGRGGLAGQPGGNGLCVMTAFNPRAEASVERAVFFHTGGDQYYEVNQAQRTSGRVETITFKCWGGGGGGGSPPTYDNNKNDLSLAMGGGSGFAQLTVATVRDGDVFTVRVAGGGYAPAGERGGQGGFGGGAVGGAGVMGGAGGGGGGASTVRRAWGPGKVESELLLLASGGGGGGGTDYCCAHGGPGGGEIGVDGSFPSTVTPWPISSARRPTGVRRRFEYTSGPCPDNPSGGFCISEWDVLAETLPAEHQNLDYGHSPHANYSAWATGGMGGGQTNGGSPGSTGSYLVRTSGEQAITMVDGLVAVYGLSNGLIVESGQGQYLRGGHGGGGKEGGGGGGAGIWGGGGGGAGIDGGGGGGGASFVNTTSAALKHALDLGAFLPAPQIEYLNETAVSLMWDLDWSETTWGAASKFAVERSEGYHNEDWKLLETVDFPLRPRNNNRTIVGRFTAGGMVPRSVHRFRVIPVFSKGRGMPSAPVLVTQLDFTNNYWEPVVTRRETMARTGRGFSNPVLGRPHLTPGVEVYDSQTSDDPLRWSDAVSRTKTNAPSQRRGHSLTLIDNLVYVFGGRTGGYQCSSVYKDFVDSGMGDSGRDVSPCATYVSEVNELWTFDIETYKWHAVNTTVWESSPPPEREQHSAVKVNGDLYIFGGKSRPLPASEIDGSAVNYEDLWSLSVPDSVNNDLWRLSVQHQDVYNMTVIDPSPVMEDTRLLQTLDGAAPSSYVGSEAYRDHMGNGTDARVGTCIDKIVVRVEVKHPCADQLRLSLIGPGPQTGSPNFHAPSASHEVTLLDRRLSERDHGMGCVGGVHSFVFDDDASTRTDEGMYHNTHYEDLLMRPEGTLAEFVGGSAVNEWTMVVEDKLADGLTGELLSWEIETYVSPCVRSYSWTNLTALGDATWPVERYSAKAVAFRTSFFIFQGRDESDSRLDDLFRYDTEVGQWTQLNPVAFDFPFDTANLAGSNLLLSPWGLMRYGGYLRQPFMASTFVHGQSYVSDVYIANPVTLRWKRVDVAQEGLPSKAVVQPDGNGVPAGRYLGASVFIPSSTLRPRHRAHYRELYDRAIPSTHMNYAGSLSDSMLMLGGHNGATGSFKGGENGGMLNDMWMLRLTNMSTSGTRAGMEIYREKHCAWRDSPRSSGVAQGTLDCLTGTGMTACELRDVIMMAWCTPGYDSQALM
jgi:hypothetical protein